MNRLRMRRNWTDTLLTLLFLPALGYRLLHLPWYSTALLVLALIYLLYGLLQPKGQEHRRAAWIANALAALALGALLRERSFTGWTVLLSLIPLFYGWGLRGGFRPQINIRSLAWSALVSLWMLYRLAPDALAWRYANLEFSVEADTDYKSWYRYGELLLESGNTEDAREALREARRRAIFQDDPLWQEKIEDKQELLPEAAD